MSDVDQMVRQFAPEGLMVAAVPQKMRRKPVNEPVGFSPAVKKEAPEANAQEAAPPPVSRGKPEPSAGFDLLDAKLRIHAKLIDELDLSALDKMDDETMRRRVRGIIGEIIRKEEMALSATEEASFADAVMDEMTGLGPIEPLLKDDPLRIS